MLELASKYKEELEKAVVPITVEFVDIEKNRPVIVKTFYQGKAKRFVFDKLTNYLSFKKKVMDIWISSINNYYNPPERSYRGRERVLVIVLENPNGLVLKNYDDARSAIINKDPIVFTDDIRLSQLWEHPMFKYRVIVVSGDVALDLDTLVNSGLFDDSVTLSKALGKGLMFSMFEPLTDEIKCLLKLGRG